MSNVHQVISSMNRFAAEDKERDFQFVGPKGSDVSEVRVGDIIEFRDRFNGNRYLGQVVSFGDGFHVGSCQMRVEVYAMNGKWAVASSQRKGSNQVNVLPEELLAIKHKAQS